MFGRKADDVEIEAIFNVRVYAVYDSKAQAFMQPFFAKNDGMACRLFQDSVRTPDSVLQAHPGDFTLFAIGAFDDSTGILHPEDTPKNLGLAQLYLAEANVPAGQSELSFTEN